MKKIIYLLLLSGIFMFSACKSDGKKDATTDDNATEESADADKKSSSGNSCDDYLADYGKWVDDYLKFLGKMKDNPGDMSLASEAMDWAEDALKWADDYAKLVDCVMDEKFNKDYMEIVEKINKAAAELYQEP